MLSAFLDDDPYEVVVERDPNPNVYSVRLISLDDVPLSIRVLVGEIATTLDRPSICWFTN